MRFSLHFALAGLIVTSMFLGTAKAEDPGYIMWFVGNSGGLYYAPPRSGWYTQIARPRSVGFVSAAPMSMLPGNRRLVVNEYDPGGLILSVFDFDTGRYDHTAPLAGAPTNNNYSLIVDQEGDLLVLPTRPDGLYRLGRDLRWQRVGVLPSIIPQVPSRAVLDLKSGDYIVSQTGGIFRIRPSGTTSLISSLQLEVTGQDPETGEFLMWGPTWGGNTLYLMTGMGVVTTSSITWSPSVYVPTLAIVDDQADEYVVVANTTGSATGSVIGRVPRTGGSVIPYIYPLRNCYDLILDRTQNISTANAGAPNRWQLLVDFPYDAGFPYAVLAGTSGFSPGLQLPDGRKIRLNADPITALALLGAIPGVSGLLGSLDSRGTAQGLIDFSGIGPAARGIPFWLVGLVLDPAAPSGIRRISPPIVVQIR